MSMLVCAHTCLRMTALDCDAKYLVHDGHKDLGNGALEHEFFESRDLSELSLTYYGHKTCGSNDPHFVDQKTES